MAQTADQVVVEIRAVIDQYTQAIKKVADDTKRSMAAVEGAVTKAEATVTKASNNAVAAIDQSSRRRMKAAADVATSEQAAAERSARAISMTADITERSAARIEAASRRRQDVPAVVLGTAAGLGASPAQAAAASGRDMAAESEKKESVGASFIKEAAKGLPDLVKGLVEGQSALHVFMQQGAQLLPVFGIWGAVLGGVVGAIDAVAGGLGAYESAADRAKTAQDSFNRAIEASKGLYSESEQQARDLALNLSLAQRGLLDIAENRIRQALDDNLEKLKDAKNQASNIANSLSAQISKANIDNQFFDGSSSVTIDEDRQKRIEGLNAKFDELIEKLKDPNLTGTQLAQMNATLRDTREAAAALGIDLGPIISKMTAASDAALQYSDSQKQLIDNHTRLNEAQQFWAKILEGLGFTIPEATGHVNGLSGALDGYISRLLQLNSVSGALPNSANSVVAGLRQDVVEMGDTVKSQQDYLKNQTAVTMAEKAWSEELKKNGNLAKAAFAYGEAYLLQTQKTRKQDSTQSLGRTTAEEDLKNLQAQATALDGTKAAQQRVAAEQRATTAANAAYNKSLLESGDEKQAAAIKSATYAAQLAIETKNQQAAGAAAANRAAPKDDHLSDYLAQLQVEVDRLGLSGVALKENQLLTEALSKAKEDFRAKNKGATDEMVNSVKLTDDQTQAIKAQAEVLAGTPGILNLAADKLPQFNLAQQLKELTEWQGLLTDPSVVATLQAQGLSAEDAGRAIQAQILQVKAQADGTTEAITSIGDAFKSGIQGATSLADAMGKIGLALLQMAIQAAAFGNTKSGGPLGGLFDSIFGTVGGLLSAFGGGGGVEPTNLPGGMSPTAFYTDPAGRAGGGQALPGQIYQVGETGREWFAPSVPGQVIPNSVIKNAASGGGGGSGPPIQFNISMAGANGDRTIAEIAAAAVKKGLQSVPEINRQHRIRFA